MDLQLTAKAVFVTLLLAGALTFIAVSLSTLTIYNHGSLSTINVEAYQDIACTIPLTDIDWGQIAPGETKNVSCYFRNEGNVNIVLSLTTSNYQPAIAETYLTLTWNYTDTPLTPNQIELTRLDLAIATDVEGFVDFNFNITIEGIQ